MEQQEEVADVESTEAVEEISIEEKAKAMGWKEPDEFRGDPEHALSAEDFVRKGEEELPVLKDNMRKMRKELAQIKRDTKSYADMIVENTLAEAKAKQRKAVEDGDIEAFEEADKTIEQIKQAPQENPQQAINDFISRNPWYQSDPVKTAYANEMDRTVGGADAEEHFRLVEEAVAKQFPEKKQRPPSVEGAVRKRKANGSKTYEGMDEDSRITCDRLVKNGFVTKEAYVENYYKNREGR